MSRKNDDGRIRSSIPITGLNTSVPDLQVPDGAMQELHNFRHTGEGWRNVRPLTIEQEFHADTRNAFYFSRLSILYHHPAADDGVYIVSIPNHDGTIDLYQAEAVDGTLRLRPEISDEDGELPVCPISYSIIPFYTGDQLSYSITFESFFPIASDLNFGLSTMDASGTARPEVMVTMKKGTTRKTAAWRAPLSSTMVFGPLPEYDDTYRYRLRKSINESVGTLYQAFATNVPADIRISHFGNILMLTDTVKQQISSYILFEGNYRLYRTPPPPIIQESISKDFIMPEIGKQTADKNGITWYYKWPIYNTQTNVYYLSKGNSRDHWHGEIAYFAAYKMTDGTHIAPSAIHLCASELRECSQNARKFDYPPLLTHLELCTVQYLGLEDEPEFFIRSFTGQGTQDNKPVRPSVYRSVLTLYILPEISISISDSIDTRLIESVTVFSTRINPIYDSEKMNSIAARTREYGPIYDITAITSDNDLANQPFYKVKDIPISDFEGNTYKLKLTFSLLNNIEQNIQYEAVQSLHDIYYVGSKEYNARLHEYGLSTTLFPGYTQDMVHGLVPETDKTDFYTRLTANNRTYTTVSSIQGRVDALEKMLSYPDHRAESIQLFLSEESIGLIKLRPATAINMAVGYQYATSEETVKVGDADIYGRDDGYRVFKYVKYPVFTLHREDDTPPKVENRLTEMNRLQISGLNNPLKLPFENSYIFGSDANVIRAVNSAAIEMSDAKFGEFPLYVFTDEGIFTMQNGSGDVLYSAVIPLNYDRIINSRTMAINYNILYITSNGIHALSSNASLLISEPINDIHNRPLLDFLQTAYMCYQHKFNEVIFYNPTYDKGIPLYPRAYIFSLNTKTWSTRDFFGTKINTDQIVFRLDASTIQLFDLNDESDGISNCRLVSRPIKLGSMEFKRLETLIARIRADTACPVRICLEGTVDLKQWIKLRECEQDETMRDITVRRTPRSFRYLRIVLETEVAHDFELAGFDLEYYLRFLHRMR